MEKIVVELIAMKAQWSWEWSFNNVSKVMGLDGSGILKWLLLMVGCSGAD